MKKHSMEKHLVEPIKDSTILKQVEDTLLASPVVGQRNYTIFQVGKATLLRVSDVLALRMDDIFDQDGNIKKNAYIRDKKTGKPNTLYLRPVEQDLLQYRQWLEDQKIDSEWLFPSIRTPKLHIKSKTFYKAMAKTGDMLGLNYLGTHTMRKTGAYRVYEQSGHNIALVMRLLNHSRETTTLEYLGLDQIGREQLLDGIDFG